MDPCLTLFCALAEAVKARAADTPTAFMAVGATVRTRGWRRATTADIFTGWERRSMNPLSDYACMEGDPCGQGTVKVSDSRAAKDAGSVIVTV